MHKVTGGPNPSVNGCHEVATNSGGGEGGWRFNEYPVQKKDYLGRNDEGLVDNDRSWRRLKYTLVPENSIRQECGIMMEERYAKLICEICVRF